MSSTTELIDKFQSNELVISGAFSIWGVYVGKPGERISILKNIKYYPENNILQLIFNTDIVKIVAPNEIKITSKSFQILNAESIERISNFNHESFSGTPNESPAFLFISW